MITEIIFFGIGAIFGMSKYGQPIKNRLKKSLDIKYNIIQYSDETYGVRCTVIGMTFYKNLYYKDKSYNKWLFKSDPQFSELCKGTFDECKNALKEEEDKTETETVIED